jgi:hypothetical protein
MTPVVKPDPLNKGNRSKEAYTHVVSTRLRTRGYPGRKKGKKERKKERNCRAHLEVCISKPPVPIVFEV